MGFIDDMTGAVDRGVAAVGRTTKSAQLKMQLSDLKKRRRDLAAQLGASLYEATNSNPAFRVGREALYDGIESIDRQCGELTTQIEAIEAFALSPVTAVPSTACPKCGEAIRGDDLFCRGCGKPVNEARTETQRASGRVGVPNERAAMSICPSCGSRIAEQDRFCMNCGTHIGLAGETSDSDSVVSARTIG
ncbi:MAG: zinc ribbon domain-containing protein [Eggerthellaceae bacterium]|nr:zinc ribbon domain-containing protein [Eggerthellaceae bacterium]